MAKKSLKDLVKEETRRCLKEYFHTSTDGRQKEVQEFLSWHVDGEQLREFCRNPREGRSYVRQNHTEKFYWWADCDIENMFRNWR